MLTPAVFVIASIPLADIGMAEPIPLVRAAALFRHRQMENFKERGPIRFRIGPMNKVERRLVEPRLTAR